MRGGLSQQLAGLYHASHTKALCPTQPHSASQKPKQSASAAISHWWGVSSGEGGESSPMAPCSAHTRRAPW
jgi:hypothetical protein